MRIEQHKQELESFLLGGNIFGKGNTITKIKCRSRFQLYEHEISVYIVPVMTIQ